MPTLFNHLDAAWYQVKNLVLHLVSGAPPTPEVGQVWFDTSAGDDGQGRPKVKLASRVMTLDDHLEEPDVVLVYGESFGTNEAFKNVGGTITHVTSLDSDPPHVDGLTLESGSPGQSYPVAVRCQQPYATPLALPVSPRVLFLAQDGKLTGTPPSSSNGDIWSLKVARRLGDHQFVFSPGVPIRLSQP